MNKKVKSLMDRVGVSLISHYVVVGISALAGFGVLFLALANDAANLLLALAQAETSLGVSIVLTALSMLLGYRVGRPSPDDETARHDFFVFDDLAWRYSYYKTGECSVEFTPYCPQHKMKLVEHSIIYVCPMSSECDCTCPSKNLVIAHDRASSVIASRHDQLAK